MISLIYNYVNAHQNNEIPFFFLTYPFGKSEKV